MDGDRNENWWILDREFESEAGRLSMWLLTPFPWRDGDEKTTHFDINFTIPITTDESLSFIPVKPLMANFSLSCLTLSSQQKRNYTWRIATFDRWQSQIKRKSFLTVSRVICFLPDRLIWEEYNKKDLQWIIFDSMFCIRTSVYYNNSTRNKHATRVKRVSQELSVSRNNVTHVFN